MDIYQKKVKKSFFPSQINSAVPFTFIFKLVLDAKQCAIFIHFHFVFFLKIVGKLRQNNFIHKMCLITPLSLLNYERA